MPNSPMDDFPVLYPEQIAPNGVNLVTMLHENFVNCFLHQALPQLDLPSTWRLAKYVTSELGPLMVYRFSDPGTQTGLLSNGTLTPVQE